MPQGTVARRGRVIFPAAMDPVRHPRRAFNQGETVMAEMQNVGTDVGQLRQDIASIKGDLGTLMTTLKDLGVEQGKQLYSRAQDAGDAVRGQAVQTQEQVGHYIESRPISSVLMAFGTGFAIGTLVGSRSYH
ncbi:hypothetical protein MishRS11D_45060 (plasmid) [Methylomagnum ishizawai]|nr:hypothetical protein MishRS11D_45060 [Methylomagnum ishizawai]